jgi:hypothetical protein
MSFLPPGAQIAFLILLFFVGLAGRRAGLFGPPQAAKMLQLVMLVGLPSLFLADVSRVPLNRETLLLPAITMGVILVTFGIGLAVGRSLQLPRASFGAFVLCVMALNNGFIFPFVLAAWGREAFALIALVDLGNALLLVTLFYAFAAAYGGHAADFRAIVKRTVTFPPLWALGAALLLNVSGYRLPDLATEVLGTVGRVLVLLVILALGILFDPKRVGSRQAILAVGLRIGLGLALGFLAAELFALEGLVRKALILGVAAPIGFNVVVIANREHLDRELAASAASLSVLLGLAYVPLLLWLL